MDEILDPDLFEIDYLVTVTYKVVIVKIILRDQPIVIR